MFVKRALCLIFLATLLLGAGALAATKVARYGYAVGGNYNVMPYAIDSATGYLRFTAEQDLSGPPCAEYGQVAIAPSQKFFYLPTSCGQVVATSIGANGILTPITGSPFTIGTSLYNMAIAPSGKFAYLPDISAYPTVTIIPVSVNKKSGALSQLSGGVSYSASSIPMLTMDPLGKFLYALDLNGGVYVYALNSTTGALTPVAGSPFSTGGSQSFSLAISKGGKFAMVQLAGALGVLKVTRTTGILTPVAGSPFTTSGDPDGEALDPNGHFVYVGYLSGNIGVYHLNATGKLAEVAGSPFSTDSLYSAAYMSLDPSGHYLYTTASGLFGGNSELQVISVNTTTGALTPLQTIASPFGAGLMITTGTTPVSFSPTYAYAANSPVATSPPDDIVEFSISPNSGTLTQVGSVPDINGPQQLILSPLGNYVYASDNLNVIGYTVQGNGSLKVFTNAQASAHAILEDPNAAFIYFAAGAEAGDWFLDQSTGQIAGNFGAYYFPGNVVAMATSFGAFGDFVISDANTLSEIYRGSNTGATTGVFSIGNGPSAVAMDGAGRFVYAANSADNTVSGFITFGDSLQPLNGGTPFSAGTTPSAIVGDAHGFYLYVANSGSHDLWVYSIDPVSGNLTPIGSPVMVGNAPASLNVDYSGKFLYCANSGDGTISTFTINANGTLTPSGTVTVDSSLSTPAPTSIVTTGTYQ